MERLQRAIARVCGKLPGRSGLVGYVVCCVLPCKSCWQKRRASSARGAADEAALLPSVGTRQVLILGLEGAGKSSFLWLCEHPSEAQLPDGAPLSPTAGVHRLMRKEVPNHVRKCKVDLELCEVGGSRRVRPFWQHYMTRSIRALAFFVSAATADEAGEAAAAFVEACAAARSRMPSARFVLVVVRLGTAGALAPAEVREAVMSRAVGTVDVDRVVCADLILAKGCGAAARQSADELLAVLAAAAAT
mmetsp:Transcript_66216/g.184372  ORF Transcript_66216/g.184372 Transcript_66216/m.184372 type:complete len:247 (-) Transcript_66216:46-786(-)|eukprot:CAMPEP_0117548276 /NCGR_PEP_ID=MMETSP0784-20121206/47568_1 /TAXON_ID=39447 /ORGANISM="" /LENGTH=246 /DNA_ID=CAMNT_0005345231 /DNA_START=39 /DNA_END=776 /DNA_ORIENTATION=-